MHPRHQKAASEHLLRFVSTASPPSSGDRSFGGNPNTDETRYGNTDQTRYGNTDEKRHGNIDDTHQRRSFRNEALCTSQNRCKKVNRTECLESSSKICDNLSHCNGSSKHKGFTFRNFKTAKSNCKSKNLGSSSFEIPASDGSFGGVSILDHRIKFQNYRHRNSSKTAVKPPTSTDPSPNKVTFIFTYICTYVYSY